uniref:Non-haem dioxygenase N-terminal domain-containing protein n=1 Tax=Setaria viridis TaxID=4556 RepID=A0A4U6UHB1_SETVI|nr:hypothetical protein SEVIR_5G161550v2 [Setaria viridis]
MAAGTGGTPDPSGATTSTTRGGAGAAPTNAIGAGRGRDAEEPTGSGVVSCDPSRRRLEPPRPNSQPMWTAALVPWRRIHRPPGCSFLLSPGVSIPAVDLSLPAPVAAATAEAARCWGFFHLVSHHQALAVPEDYPAQALVAVGAFNELPAAERSAHYGHSMAGGIPYFSDVDLFRTSTAS